MKTIFTCLFISVALFGFGQQNTFKVRVFEPSNLSDLYQVIQLNDGSFVGIGDAILTTGGFYRLSAYLIKTDAGGNVLASKSIESMTGGDDGSSIAKTSDGGFIVSGSADTFAISLIKFRADLSIAWQKEYRISGVDESGNTGTVLQTKDGGYMVTNSFNTYNEDGLVPAGTCLVKTDAQGNVQFAKQYFNVADRVIYDMAATTDGNYVMLGESLQSEFDSSYLIKIDPQGAILWSRAISEDAETLTDFGRIAATSDGGIVMCGESYQEGNSTGDDKLVMVKYNNAGMLQWSKKIASGPYTASYGGGVTEDSDGGYVFAGGLDLYRDNGDNDTAYAYLVKTDSRGNLLWTRAVDKNTENGYADVADVIRTNDGGYVVCGIGDFYNTEAEGYYSGSFLYKLDANGQLCNEIPDISGSLETGIKEAAANIFTGTLSVTSPDLNLRVNNAGAIDNVCQSSALPLQLLSFNATLQNKSVSVNWTTANEVNTDYFVVERSANGAAFTHLQKITAKGNSSVTQTYNTTDLQPLPGTSYYRLKETDKDGKITYSSVVPVTVLNNGVVIISPNPVRDAVRVIMQSQSSATVTYQVVDMKGAVLATQKASVSSGRNEILIPAASLAKGAYMLKVMSNTSIQTVRFIKE